MTSPAKAQRPIDVLREVLAELGARKLSAAGYLGRKGHGFSVEFYWVANGGPLILQLTADGGYDLYVPMLNTLDAELTVQSLREYAAGFHGAVALHRQLAASVSFPAAPDPSGDTPATPESDRGASDPLAAKAAALDGLLWNGCLTGDCPHSTQAECDKALADHVRELAGERGSSDQPAAKQRGAEEVPDCDYHALHGDTGLACGGGRIAVMMRVGVPGVRGETRYLCRAVAETWAADGKCEILKEG